MIKPILINTKVMILASVLLTAQYVNAQTGPGGVGNAATNVIWLKANAGTSTTIDGAAVSGWNDQSGNIKNAAAGAGQEPVYKANIINSTLPVLRFTAASNHRMLSTGVSSSSTLSLWAVVQYSSLPSANPGIVQGSPAGLAFSTIGPDKSVGLWVENTGKVWGRGVQSDGIPRNLTKVTTLSPGTFYIINTVYDGTNIKQYVNNAISGTAAYNGTLKSWSDFGVGRQGSETWNGDIAEVFAFNFAANTAQRLVADNYLSSKYNIALSSNDKYSGDIAGNGDYDSEVTGIGRMDASNTYATAYSAGLHLAQSANFGDGDYLFAGHKTVSNSVNASDIGGMSGSDNARWERIWYFDVTETSAPASATNITFDMSEGGMSATPATPANYVLLYRAGQAGNWTELAVGSSIAGDQISFTGVTLSSDGYYTLGTKNKASSPLPIQLLSFDARLVDKVKVELNWKTATEVNNDYFTIERSKNGATFEDIGHVKGSGNSSSEKTYSLVDDGPYEGNSYYRLKQTDFDGKNETFEMVAVYYEKQPGGGCILKVFPNPCAGQCTVALTDCISAEDPEINVELIDAAGNKVYSKIPYRDDKGSFNFQIDTENNLTPGVYIVRGINKKESYAQKLLVK
ncbi:MAG: T9SS type A sorting domain-containing protein [Bacteroidetes bacterium]|nr:T9SS type A sorting domain-containing protein [Bacteroidota bacterium]